jgi:YVTN family beta-propeller protein
LVAGTSRIYVLNHAGTTIQVINPATNKTVQVIRDIEVPEGIGFSPDGSRVYIANSAGENLLRVLDQKTGKVIKKIPLSGQPNDLAVTQDGRRILVCIHDIPGGLDIIDATSLEKVKTIPSKNKLHDVILTPDGKYAVVGSYEGNFATVIDLQSKQAAWEIQFDKGVRTMAIETGPNNSTRRIFVDLSDLNGFAVVDFAKRAEVARINFPDKPNGYGWAGLHSVSHGIAIAPDGKTLWANSNIANSLFVYSLPELTLLGRVPLRELKLQGQPPIGAVAEWLTFTPDSKTVYVSNAALKSVSAIDVKTRKEVALIPAGEVPDRIITLETP